MNNARLNNDQMLEFIRVRLYKESAYNDIKIYAYNGMICAEYTGDNKPRDKSICIIAKSEYTYDELHNLFRKEFNTLLERVKERGNNLTIDANLLVRNRKTSESIIKANKNIREFRNLLIKTCFEFNKITSVVVSEKADKIYITHKNEQYVMSVPDYNEIKNSQRHEGILKLIESYLTELMNIITEE